MHIWVSTHRAQHSELPQKAEHCAFALLVRNRVAYRTLTYTFVQSKESKDAISDRPLSNVRQGISDS